MSDDIKDIIKAREFHLVDKNGNVRLRMQVNDNGDLMLAMADDKGVYGLTLDLDADGDTGIYIHHSNGNHIDLGIDSNGEPYFEHSGTWRKS